MTNESGVARYLTQLIDDGRVKACSRCRQTDALRIVLMQSGTHWGKVVCDACGTEEHPRHVDWVKKPESAKRSRREPNSIGLLADIRAARDGEPLYCEICLRDERHLPTGVGMEAHHILEHQDSGSNHIANLQPLCSSCHEWVHWRRRDVGGVQVGKEAPHEPAPV